MRNFKVIALSCNSKNGILSSGDTVTEDAFGEGEADELVKEGFLQEIKSTKSEKQEKSLGKQLVDSLKVVAIILFSMGLVDQAKADIEQITSTTDDWAVSITLIAPTLETVTLTGLHTKHHLSIDVESGKQVNAKNAHISVSEKFMTDALYPVRDLKGDVNLKNHRVRVKDSTGEVKDYVINQWFPDETIGLITCILGDYKNFNA